MASNFDASLVNKVLSQAALTKVQNKLAFLGAFTTDFSDEVRDKRSRSVMVPFVSGGNAVQTNPTNFETGDTEIGNRTITLDHISKSFNITSADYGVGRRLEMLAQYNMEAVASKIEAMVFTLLTEANYGAPAVTGITAGAMSVGNLKTLYGAIPGDVKVAILKDNEFANLLPSDLNGFDITRQRSGYGYDVIDRSGAGFASAGTKIVGFGANPAAIVMASALPEYHPGVGDLLDLQTVEIPGLGISVQSCIWGSTGTRNVWGSFDVLFGAQVGDGAAGKLVKTI